MGHVFISYSHLDIKFVEWLIHVLARLGIETWTDARIRGGHLWKREIDYAIETAFAVLVVVTPASRASEYVTYEWSYASGLGKTIIPLMVNITDMHPKLEDFQGFIFSKRQNPMNKIIERLVELRRIDEQITRALPAPAPHLQPLLDDLEHANEYRREAALHTLGNLGDPSVIPNMRISLYDRVDAVRIRAINALGEIGDRRATPLLITLIRNRGTDRETAGYAYIALGQIACPQGLKFLLDELNSSQWLDQNGTSHLVAVALPSDIAERMGTQWAHHRARLSASCAYYADRINQQFEELHRDIVTLAQSIDHAEPDFLRARAERIEDKLSQASHAGEILTAVCRLTEDTFDSNAFSNRLNRIVKQLKTSVKISGVR